MGQGPIKYSSLEEQAEAEEQAMVNMSKEDAVAEAPVVAPAAEEVKPTEATCDDCHGCDCKKDGE